MKKLLLALCLAPLSMWAQSNIKTEVIEKDSVVLVVSTQIDSATVSSQRLLQEIDKIKQEIEKREVELKTFRAQLQDYTVLLGQIVQTEKRINARRNIQTEKKK